MPQHTAREPTADRGDTVEQLRWDIDRGATHEKVPGSDPAVAPLGTDDEAAGTPLPPDVIAAERERALRTGRGRPSAPADGPPGLEWYWSWLALPTAVVLLVAAFLLARRL